MKPSRWSYLVLSFPWVVIAVVVVGFWIHTSDTPEVLGKYSRGYFLAVCCITALGVGAASIAWLLVTPQIIHLRSGPRIVTQQTKLLTVLVLAILGFVAAEVALTRWERQRLGPRGNIATYHPYLQHVPEAGDTVMHINRWRFRGDDIEKVKPPNTYRIFALGGSTVYCGEVDFEHTFCRLLENRLREANPHVRIEVQNAGAGSHTTQHSLMRFLFEVQDFDPDLIISLQGYNDLFRSFTPPYLSQGEFQPDYSHYFGLVARMYREYAATDSETYFRSEALRQAAKSFDKWFSDIRHPTKLTPAGPIPFSDWKSLHSYERNCRDLVTIVCGKRIELVMASQPTLLREEVTGKDFRSFQQLGDSLINDRGNTADSTSLCRGLDLFNQTAETVAQEYGVTFVDLANRVPKEVKYFTDLAHFTEAGNLVIADALAETINGQGFVEQKFPKQSASQLPDSP